MSRKTFAAFLLLAAAAGGAYYYKTHYMKPPAPTPPPNMMGMIMPVNVAEVLQREVQQWHEYSGRLTAVDYVEVRSRVSGAIDSVNFADGAVVKKGDLLFVIDPRPYAADVARAEAALTAAKAARDLNETNFRRAQKLIEDKAISQGDFDTRKNEIDAARAQVKSAEAQLDTAKLSLGYTKIKSPIDGRVSRAELTVGNLVQSGPNSPLLTTVVSQSPIYADFDIDEQAYLTLAPALASKDIQNIPVKMTLTNNNVTYEGRVQSFDNHLDMTSGTVRVRAVFDNADGALVPGLFARIHLGNPAMTNALLISDKAVGTDQSKKFVYVVGAENKVEYREIKLGDTAGNLRIITEGLKPGDRVIVEGLQRAHPGAEVKPEPVSMEETTAPAPAAEEKKPEAAAPEEPKDAPTTDDAGKKE